MRKSTQSAISTPVLPTPGQRVHLNGGGCQYEDGMTLTQITTEWGTHALILMDNGSIKQCNGLNRRPGIGWHDGPSRSRLWEQQQKEGK